MDDENVYGPLFSQYNFGAAIKDKTISDYKIVVAGVKESEVYNYIAENKHISVGDLDNNEKTTTAEILYSKILLAKAMGEFPIKKQYLSTPLLEKPRISLLKTVMIFHFQM